MIRLESNVGILILERVFSTRSTVYTMCTLSDVEAAENVILSSLLLSYFLRVCDLLSKLRGRKIRGLSVYLMVVF